MVVVPAALSDIRFIKIWAILDAGELFMKKGKITKTKKVDLAKAVNDSMKETVSDDDCDCQCHACDCCESDECCGKGSCESGSECCSEPEQEMTMEQMERSLTDAAEDVWMKLFLQACEKEWQKQAGKNIQKLAAEHVKRSKAEWEQKKKGK